MEPDAASADDGDYTATLDAFTDDDGLGDTLLPYDSSGNIASGRDWLPLTVTNTTPIISPTPQVECECGVFLGSTTVVNIILNEPPNGLSGYNLTVSLSNGSVAEIVSVSFPPKNQNQFEGKGTFCIHKRIIRQKSQMMHHLTQK